ncbi:MAG: hypothetical protein SGI87_11770 [Flavobacteriales bacterium]|nr:hypothetical protein [Flavobacteriales bacterium]
MEKTMDGLEPLLQRVEEFGRTNLELFKLNAISQTTEVVSNVVSRGTVVLVVSLFLVFGSIGVALWLGELLGKSYLGFFCVAGFYIVLGGVLYFLLHPWIKRMISNSLIVALLKK